MDPISAIESAISIIPAIKSQSESTSSNIKTCKLLAKRCEDLIPSLNSIKSNYNSATNEVNTSSATDADGLQSLSEVLKSCELFIISHGQKWTMSQFFNSNIIRDEFYLMNERLNASITSLSLGDQVDNELQLQESSDALASDIDELKATVVEVANKHNINLDQICDNSVDNNKIVIKYMQSILDATLPPTVVKSEPSSLDAGSPEAVVRESVKVPACPVCLSEYSDSQKCYLVCSNGHSLCAVCKGPSTRGGKCPVCRGPCLPGGGFVNRAVMDVVEEIARLDGPPISNPSSPFASSKACLPSAPALSLAATPPAPPSSASESPAATAGSLTQVDICIYSHSFCSVRLFDVDMVYVLYLCMVFIIIYVSSVPYTYMHRLNAYGTARRCPAER